MTDPSGQAGQGPASGDYAGRIELAPGVRAPEGALRFTYARSGGPGGQNVNKRETKAQLRLDPSDLPLDDRVRERLVRLAGSWMTDAGELLIVSDEHRSQRRNRDECLQRLRRLLIRARQRPKARKPTRPSRAARERRLRAKRERAERKRNRRPPDSS